MRSAFKDLALIGHGLTMRTRSLKALPVCSSKWCIVLQTNSYNLYNIALTNVNPYVQVSDVLCYKPIPIIYITSLLQNSIKVIAEFITSMFNMQLSKFINFHISIHYIILLIYLFPVPSAVESLAVSDVAQTAIRVTWQEPNFPNGNIKFYEVTCNVSINLPYLMPLLIVITVY